METLKKTHTTYKDIYQEVTETVIKALEEGTIIWQCSWNECGFPRNYVTNTYYRGWNIFLLNFHTLKRNYPTAEYLTYKQANLLGGTIRKGERGVKIIYWATIELKDDKDKTLIVNNVDSDEKKQVKLLPKAHTVFNIAQVEGIDFLKGNPIELSLLERIDNCEKVVGVMPLPPKLNLNGDKAYYMLSTDLVVVPSLTRSISAEEYYGTLFHEIAHSTGHSKRLNRKELLETEGFGKTNYAKEELTAEMTAAYLCAVTGIGQPTIANSAAYIDSWLKALKNDKTLIIKAASQAQKAANYILQSEKVIEQGRGRF
jgi:antirestriction protein ArdC